MHPVNIKTNLEVFYVCTNLLAPSVFTYMNCFLFSFSVHYLEIPYKKLIINMWLLVGNKSLLLHAHLRLRFFISL